MPQTNKVSSPRIIVGAGRTRQKGWIALQRDELDIRDAVQWRRLFVPGTVEAVLSEHVLEHLYPDEARETAVNISQMLSSGGWWRIAVPDANNPDPNYQDYLRPNGPGQQRHRFFFNDDPNHKVHYNISSLSRLLRDANLQPYPLEWYDERGRFHRNAWLTSKGAIKRRAGSLYSRLTYLWARCINTSLIVDGIKE